MEAILYASIVGSIMYSNRLKFAIGMLGRYQSNPGMKHWKAAKKVLRYL